MRERLLRFVSLVVGFFNNLWNRTWTALKTMANLNLNDVVQKPLEEPEIIPEVNVGDIAINPQWTWIDVVNPKGRRNANCFHDFGDRAGIKEGGKLTVVATEEKQVLVSYESPNGQGAGTEAGNGTLFFVSKRQFVSMTPAFENGQDIKEKQKAHVMELLRSALPETENPVPPDV